MMFEKRDDCLSLEEREQDFSALFQSILSRINDKRKDKDKIVVFDREVHEACIDFASCYNDVIIWRDK